MGGTIDGRASTLDSPKGVKWLKRMPVWPHDTTPGIPQSNWSISCYNETVTWSACVQYVCGLCVGWDAATSVCGVETMCALWFTYYFIEDTATCTVGSGWTLYLDTCLILLIQFKSVLELLRYVRTLLSPLVERQCFMCLPYWASAHDRTVKCISFCVSRRGSWWCRKDTPVPRRSVTVVNLSCYGPDVILMLLFNGWDNSDSGYQAALHIP